jgi:formylglycine-generating enzyme required for sulfatase activity
MAYCEWLRNKTGRAYWLPTEAQWEKAARGTDGWLYPWGSEWEENRCNTGNAIIAKDAFKPQSVYGCYDMVGNASEWTLTIWGRRSWIRDEEYSYEWGEDGRNDTADWPNMRRVIRGGRHDSHVGYRCSNCDGCLADKAGLSDNPIGFRVVLLLDG